MQDIKLIFIAGFAVFLLFCPAATLAEEADDIVILLDQSASMKKYHLNSISKVVLTTLRSLEKSYRVTLVGFDDKIHEYATAVTVDKKSMDALARKIGEIRINGLSTDMEMPLKYLLQRQTIQSVGLAIIVSDGKPEIWDEGRWILSRRVQSDIRYEDINKQHRALTGIGLSPRELFDRFGSLYQERNVQLIEQQLSHLKDTLGGRLIFLDVSEKSTFFQLWAAKAVSQYLPIGATKYVMTEDEVRNQLLALRMTMSLILTEPIPRDHELKREPVRPESDVHTEPITPNLGIIPSISLEHRSIPEQPEQASLTTLGNRTEPDPASVNESKASKNRMYSIPVIATLLALLTIMTFIFVIVLILRRRSSGTAIGRSGRNQPAELEVDQSFEMVQEGIGQIDSPSRAEVPGQQIDQTIKVVLDKGDRLRLKIMEVENETFRAERRFSLRISVPPGAMEIYWTNDDGEVNHGAAIDISLRGILFQAEGFDSASIDKIVCHSLGFTLPVKRSRIRRRERDRVVAIVEEFQNNIESQMKWIEILTRIEEGR